MIIINVTITAPVGEVWEAITDGAKTKEWYFNFSNDFILEKGRKFDWTAGPPNGKQWLHRGEMLDIIPNNLLSHSWEYPGYSGTSKVTWKLTPLDKNTTQLEFKHQFVIPFDPNVPELHVDNFRAGWDQIINHSLVDYLSKRK